jgi:hypothetical protein
MLETAVPETAVPETVATAAVAVPETEPEWPGTVSFLTATLPIQAAVRQNQPLNIGPAEPVILREQDLEGLDSMLGVLADWSRSRASDSHDSTRARTAVEECETTPKNGYWMRRMKQLRNSTSFQFDLQFRKTGNFRVVEPAHSFEADKPAAWVATPHLHLD